MGKVRKSNTCFSLVQNDILALMGLDDHLRFSCPLHHFENSRHFPVYDNLLPFQVTNWNGMCTICIAPPNEVVPYKIYYSLELLSSSILLPERNKQNNAETFPHIVYTIYSVQVVFYLVLLFGSIVYIRAKVYIHQDFFKVVVHVIIIDHWNQTARLYEIQVTVINILSILVTVTSECRVNRVIWKTWTGTLVNSADTDQTPLNVASDRGLHCLLKLQEVTH